MLTQPGTGTGGLALNPFPQVEVVDNGGNRVETVVSDTSVRAALVQEGAVSLAVLSGSVELAAQGVVSFPDLAVSTVGSLYQLEFSDAAGLLRNVTSANFTVLRGDAARLVLDSPGQQPGWGYGGEALRTQPIAMVADAGGNQVASAVSVKAAIGENGGVYGVLGGSLEVQSNNETGLAIFTDLKLTRYGGGYTLVFSAVGSALSRVESTRFTIAVGNASALKVLRSPTASTTDKDLTTQPVVSVVDAGGTVFQVHLLSFVFYHDLLHG